MTTTPELGPYPKVPLFERTESRPLEDLIKVLISLAYPVVAIGGFLAIASAVNRFGSRFELGRISISTPDFVCFCTVLPALLVGLFAVLATFDAARNDNLRPYSLAVAPVWFFHGLWALVTLALILWISSDDWMPGNTPTIAHDLHAATWLIYAFSIPGFIYAAYNAGIRTRRLVGSQRPPSWTRHFLAGAIPTAVLATFALVLYLADRDALITR